MDDWKLNQKRNRIHRSPANFHLYSYLDTIPSCIILYAYEAEKVASFNSKTNVEELNNHDAYLIGNILYFSGSNEQFKLQYKTRLLNLIKNEKIFNKYLLL